jgi:predicted transcriptional regulator YheO
VNLFNLVRMEDELKNLFGREVDLVVHVLRSTVHQNFHFSNRPIASRAVKSNCNGVMET